MNFEKAYENYKQGTATEEERLFVEGEIEKAKRLNSIIDEIDGKKKVIAQANSTDIKKAKVIHTVKSAIRTLLITAAVLIIAAGAICGGVFGTAVSSAKSGAKYSVEDAKAIAVEYVKKNYQNSDGGAVIVTETDRNLDMKLKLNHSTYIYYIDVQNGARMEVELIVDSRTGAVTLEGIDHD